MAVVENGPWIEGLNSLIDPLRIGEGQYQWGVNVVNRGGRIQTRPAFKAISSQAGAEPLGLALFTPKGSVPILVRAAGGAEYTEIRYIKYPFTGNWLLLAGIRFKPHAMVHFETAVKASSTDSDGNVSRVDPYPVLMMSDGSSRTAFWDGVTARHLDPTRTPDKSETPVGSWMKWIGSRLWIFDGRKGYASNFLDPLKFTETQYVFSGGFFVLPDECTGLGSTPDFKTLLAFTDMTTTAFQAGITDRNSWPTTQDFQRVILPAIGCAAGRTIVNQYGLTWWMSHGGMIGLDTALQTYRTSKIHYRDQNMARSKMNLSKDVSRSCACPFENFLMLSVPSGDAHNSHTWVMDQGVVDTIDQLSPPAWASVWTGVRPVQWVTGVIEGELRCFTLSNDLPPTGGSYSQSYGNVWEAFVDEPKDIGLNLAGSLTPKNIPGILETRFMGDSEEYKTFDYAEIDIDEISDQVSYEISYAGRRSGYKSITGGTKTIVATRASLQYADTFEDTSELENYIPQKRIIRSVSESVQPDDPSPEVETDMTRNKDRSFALLIRWTGKMSISKVRVHFNLQGIESGGRCEDSEATDRYVKPDGTGDILETGPVARTIAGLRRSRYLSTVTPRWEEEVHSSIT